MGLGDIRVVKCTSRQGVADDAEKHSVAFVNDNRRHTLR